MDLVRFCAASRVVVVAGKGGVGKTTVAATLAVAAASTGMSVLVIEVEGKSGLATCFGRADLGDEERTIQERNVGAGIRARTVTADASLLEYLDDHGLRRVSRRLVSSGALEVVATAVPGMKDILVLGKVKQLERAGVADLIVVDGPAAGHSLTFLGSARGLLESVTVGPVRRQASEVVELLTDPKRCRVLMVTLPETTPVNELVETAYGLEDRAGISLGPVVVNECLPDAGPTGDAARLADDLVRTGEHVDGALHAALAGAVSERADARSRQRQERERLARELPLPQIALPALPVATTGPSEIDVLAGAFVAGVEAMDDPWS
jgi:anion-transporting  ArsA/GET3 family ATPase